MAVPPDAAFKFAIFEIGNRLCLQQGAVDWLGRSIHCTIAQSHNLVVILITLRRVAVHAA